MINKKSIERGTAYIIKKINDALSKQTKLKNLDAYNLREYSVLPNRQHFF